VTWAAVALSVLTIATPAVASADTIEVTARVNHVNVAFLPPVGRAGNAESSLWVVRERNGNAIGDMLTDCRWVTAGLRLCVGQLSLPLGTIAVIGASRTRFIGQLAVVGGTGRYVGAAGTLMFTATGPGRYVLSVNYRKESK
jgi:hypothetical protein